jgi:hypothetical protein
MSRRPVENRRELLLPLLMPDQHQTGLVFDPCVPAGPTRTFNGKAGEPPEAWTRHTTHCRPTKQTSQTIEGGISELIAGSHLLARLVFQRIRQRTHSRIIEQSCSRHELQPTPISIAPPDVTTPLVDGAEVSAWAPVPPEVETLFTQLARCRLQSRATQEAQ